MLAISGLSSIEFFKIESIVVESRFDAATRQFDDGSQLREWHLATDGEDRRRDFDSGGDGDAIAEAFAAAGFGCRSPGVSAVAVGSVARSVVFDKAVGRLQVVVVVNTADDWESIGGQVFLVAGESSCRRKPYQRVAEVTVAPQLGFEVETYSLLFAFTAKRGNDLSLLSFELSI